MNGLRRAGVGFAIAMVAGLGAWFSVTPVHPFTIHVLDLLWLYLLVASFFALTTGRSKVPFRIWQNPVATLTFAAFFLALIIAPVIGVVAVSAPASSLSSSVRFLMFAAFPLFFAVLRLNRTELLRGLGTGLKVVVILNLAYAVLQSLEFNGVIPSGILPHNIVGKYLSGRRFSDWGRATGFFNEGNHLGYFGLFTAVFFWARFLSRPRLSTLVYVVAALALPFLGNSRSALLITVMALVLMTITSVTLRKRTRMRTLAAVAMSLLGGAAAIQILLSFQALRDAVNFSRIMRVVSLAQGNLSADNSLRIRLEELWPAAQRVFNKYPLGTGAEPSTLIGTIDSAWLTYVLQGSLPLALLFAGFLAGAVWSGLQAFSGSTEWERQVAGHALIWAAISVSIGSLVLSPHHVPALMVLFICLYYGVAGRPGGAEDA